MKILYQGYIPRGRTGGFTLIELLVVIAVMAILLTLLIPSVGTMLARAKQVKCASNLRHMGTAMLLYVNESQGRFPGHRNIPGVGGWFDAIEPYCGYGVMHCPSRRYWEDPLRPDFRMEAKPQPTNYAYHWIAYGYNAYWLGLFNWPAGFERQPMGSNFTRFSDCLNPGQTIMLADGSVGNFYGWASTLWFPKRNQRDFEGVGDPHNGKGNVVFADGHVKAYVADKINNIFDLELRDLWLPNPIIWPDPDPFGGNPRN